MLSAPCVVALKAKHILYSPLLLDTRSVAAQKRTERLIGKWSVVGGIPPIYAQLCTLHGHISAPLSFRCCG